MSINYSINNSICGGKAVKRIELHDIDVIWSHVSFPVSPKQKLIIHRSLIFALARVETQ